MDFFCWSTLRIPVIRELCILFTFLILFPKIFLCLKNPAKKILNQKQNILKPRCRKALRILKYVKSCMFIDTTYTGNINLLDSFEAEDKKYPIGNL